MKRKNAVFEILGAPKERDGVRLCDAPGCLEEGEHRAPKTRSLDSYYWFCLDHVRAYNKQWNYYAGMNEEEVERQIRFDTTWQRPTWPMGALGAAVRAYRNGPGVHFGAFGPDSWDQARPVAPDGAERNGWRPRPESPEAKALATLDLEAPTTLDSVKERYKELVKRHHPDANGGDRNAEERLKVINQAYSTLIRCDELRTLKSEKV